MSATLCPARAPVSAAGGLPSEPAPGHGIAAEARTALSDLAERPAPDHDAAEALLDEVATLLRRASEAEHWGAPERDAFARDLDWALRVLELDIAYRGAGPPDCPGIEAACRDSALCLRCAIAYAACLCRDPALGRGLMAP